MNEFVSNNIITIVAAVFVFEVLMGMLAQHLAEMKGHSKRWFWVGFLLSLAGAVWAAGLPDEALRRQLAGMSAKRDEQAAAAVPKQAPVHPVNLKDEGELAAVLAAAVAAAGEKEGRRFVMRSFRPVGGGLGYAKVPDRREWHNLRGGG
jgi:hypothetical protein